MNGFIQLWHASIHVVNLPYTLLLLLVVLYWLVVLAGMLDVDSIDLDATCPDVAGADADGADFDIPTAGFFGGLLEYLNLRKVPLSIVVSLFALSLWIIGVLANHHLHGTRSGLLGLAVLVPNILLSAHVAKFATLPLVPLFRGMRAAASSSRDLVGTRVIVTSSKVDATFGQAEIREVGAPITLMVRTEGGEILARGAEAVILRSEPEKSVHIITQLEF